MKAPTVTTIKRELRKMDNGNEPSDAAVILMSAAIVGARQTALQKFTGLPRSVVSKYLATGRANRLFTRDGKIRAEWGEGGSDSGIAFWMDVCVLEGWMARVSG